MPKKYTTDPNSGFFDEDDMPCRCDCGNWFDLHDGYPTADRFSNTLVCQECHALQEERARIEAEEDYDDESEEEGEGWDDEDDAPMSRLCDEGYD